jgi:hypothetical protein
MIYLFLNYVQYDRISDDIRGLRCDVIAIYFIDPVKVGFYNHPGNFENMAYP